MDMLSQLELISEILVLKGKTRLGIQPTSVNPEC